MRRALLAGAAALSLWGAGAGATAVTPLTLAQQAQKAEVIVRATLGTPTTAKEGDVTYTVYPLSVTETIAGDAASLPQHMGKPALFFLQGVQDLPALSGGQEVFALLYARKADSPLVGFNQGLYPVVNGAVSVSPAGSAATGAGSATGIEVAAPSGAATAPATGTTITTPTALRDAIRAARENR
ncbi:hypothetical protein [uncultured Deinococcus sp.]|uniref:hypothetical protein n=1 Tax=uncultured Deinococcus sp. TaxID=158789 RepID=UPI00258D794D|nr:hypothetical protein [uncultured Deinococcus sp.]